MKELQTLEARHGLMVAETGEWRARRRMACCVELPQLDLKFSCVSYGLRCNAKKRVHGHCNMSENIDQANDRAA